MRTAWIGPFAMLPMELVAAILRASMQDLADARTLSTTVSGEHRLCD